RNQLRDALSPTHLERLAAEVGQDHLHLAAIIVVDGTRRVEAGDAMLEREAGARADLDFVALGNRDRKSGRNRMALAGSERKIFRGDHVQSGGPVGRVGRRRQTFAVLQPLQLDVDHFGFLRADLRPAFLAGPFAARSSIRRTASSRVTPSGLAPFGSVALVAPSVTYGPYLPAITFISPPFAGCLPSTAIGSREADWRRPPPEAASASFDTAVFMPVSNTSAVELSFAYLPSCARYGP